MKQNYSATTQEPKEPKKLTPPRVKVLLAQPCDTWRHISDGHIDGLALRISPSGFGSWAVDYTRPAGGRARYTLGPEAEITLAKARELALGIRDRARRGEDPHHYKQAARLKAKQEKQQATAGTVAELAARWLASREAKAWRPATVATFESHVRRYVVPGLGLLDARSVTKADVRSLIDRGEVAVAMVTSLGP